MTTIKNISIPKPCSESWQQMTPAGSGRHCQSCCKTVTDFTGMSNKQIIDYLSNTNHVCGRFNEQQFHGINYQLYADNLPVTGGWRKFALVFSMLSATLSFKALAQTKPASVEQAPSTKNDLGENKVLIGKVASADQNGFRIIRGQVLDETNQPIPGVNIKIPPGYTGTLTDMNGDFRLSVPNTVSQFTASFIGYNTQTVNIGADNSYPLKLKLQAAFLGEVIVAKRPPFVKRVYYRFIKIPIRKIFN